MKTNIQRTPVHIVCPKGSSLIRISNVGYEVMVRQVETWIENGIMGIEEKILTIPFTGDVSRNKVLQGNIMRAYTIEMLPPEYILYRNGEPVETYDSNLVYTYLYYEPQIPYRPMGILDKSLENCLRLK